MYQHRNWEVSQVSKNVFCLFVSGPQLIMFELVRLILSLLLLVFDFLVFLVCDLLSVILGFVKSLFNPCNIYIYIYLYLYLYL